MTGPLLLSLDLEDVRDHVRDGHTYSVRVHRNTERYLQFLREYDVRLTFFVVGSVAERHPGLIREIVADGHEIACHTHTHLQLDRLTPETFRDDLLRNLDALHRCGAEGIIGFRAPTYSLTEETQWAYPVLEELGFVYSSSVLPARNPLYGWKEFGGEPRMMGGVLEMPITLHPLFMVPLAGGVYFRVLPFFFVRQGIATRALRGQTTVAYLHPHEIDVEQERFMHPDLSDSRLLNALMYVGRDKVLAKLQRLLGQFQVTTYRDHLDGMRP